MEQKERRGRNGREEGREEKRKEGNKEGGKGKEEGEGRTIQSLQFIKSGTQGNRIAPVAHF